jgi:hypothetical protein
MTGCAALNITDKDSEDIQRSKASIARLNEQMASLSKEVSLLKSEVQKMKGEEAGVPKEKEAVREHRHLVSPCGFNHCRVCSANSLLALSRTISISDLSRAISYGCSRRFPHTYSNTLHGANLHSRQ